VLRYHWTNFTSHTNDGLKRQHPTEKPVALLVEILNRWSPPSCDVADPFGGSGTTLIAAHNTGRTASLIELDTAYVDVICRRFQEHTGIKPVNQATNQEHDFLED
jgi:DNA modification methylase